MEIMKKFKRTCRFVSAAFTSLILFSFVACSSDDNDDVTPTPEPPSDIVTSDEFKSDAAGWTIIGDAQGGFVEVSWSPDGGVSDGYIFAKDDATGGVWYFSAPQSYKGNKSDYYNATLSFSLFQDSNVSNQFEYEDIVFKSNEKQLFYKHASTSDFPKKDWTNYSITISANTSGWFIGNYKDRYNGPELDYEKATEADMKAILSNLTEFWIRGEFEVGPDKGGLDNVFIRKN